MRAAKSNGAAKVTANKRHEKEASDDERKDPDEQDSAEGEEEMLDEKQSAEDNESPNELWVNPTALFEVELQQSQVIC